ncbi:MAG: PKD domain-containing protein [Euryarchaeota archaeon]|nr:PKD domain-containing protein [Euryarchaeota archaeon]MDE1881368.1 PKD domain-containing protein [Euryarchaeota archaeon]MDE2045640.1 PKD domain-containing protein [Thermoplasmata archaeon]
MSALVLTGGAQGSFLVGAHGTSEMAKGTGTSLIDRTALSPSIMSLAGAVPVSHAARALQVAPARALIPPSMPPNDSASRALPSLTVFGNSVHVSTTTITDQNGGPVFAWSNNPSTVTDSSGYVWTVWSANVTGRWTIWFAYSSNDGTSFSTPVQLDGSYATQDTSPDLSVFGSGASAHLGVVWENRTRTTINPATSDGYTVDVSTNGGTSWAATGGQSWIRANGYGPENTFEGTAGSWDSAGNFLVTFWSDFVDCGTWTTWPSCTVVGVDGFAGGTTYCVTTSCDGGWRLEAITASGAEYWPDLGMSCSSTTPDCSVLASWTNGALTTQYARAFYSTENYNTLYTSGAGSPQGPATITSSAFAGSYTVIVTGPDQITYSGGNNSYLAFELNAATASAPSYDVAYWYHTGASGNTYTRGGYPTGSATTTGTVSASIAVDGTSGGPFVSWYDSSSSVVDASWAPSISGTFLTTVAGVAAGGPYSATSIGVTTNAGASPFRVDVVYIDSGNPAAQVYYGNFFALYGAASASPTTVDLWQNVQFNSTPAAGAPAYSYSWNFGGACSPSCPTTARNPLVNYTNSGTYTTSVQITDMLGEIVTASAGTITVYPRLLVSISPSSGAVDVGQSLTFTATPSGGSGTYGANAYSWQVNGAAQAGATTSSFPYTFSAVGTTTVAASVTDSLGMTSTWATATVTVSSALSVTNLVSSPRPALVGQTVWFNATVAGGTPTLAWVWSLGFGQSSTLTNPSGKYPSSGNFTVYLNVTDSANPKVTAGTTGYVLVDSPMTVAAASAPASPVAGQTVFLNATVTGGSPAYTYSWNPGDGTGALSGAKATHAYSSAGWYNATVTVVDSLGFSAKATTAIHVLAPLSILSATGSPNPSNTTTMVTFSSAATGGLAPYTFSWNYGDGSAVGLGAWQHHNYTTANSNPGYSVTLSVLDSAGHSASQPFNEIVNPAGTGCGSACTLAVTLSYSPTSPVAGLPVTFTAGVNGGTAPYVAYAWTFGDGHTANSPTNTATNTYAAPGPYTASVVVTDSKGNTGNAQKSLTVAAAGQFTAVVSASPSTADVGEAISFAGSVTGGSGTYASYTFDFGDGSTPVTLTTAPAQVTHAYAASGTFSATLKVVDSKGATTTSAPTSVLINPAVLVVLTATTTSVDVNVNDIFTASPSGGSGSFLTSSVSWTFGTGAAAQSGSTQLGHPFSTAGTYEVRATVTDSVGGTGNGFLNVSVYPAISVSVTSSQFNDPAPVNMTITATITGGHGTYTLLWDFGDGSAAVSTTTTSSTSSVAHLYTKASGYPVVVKVTDTSGGSGTGNYTATVAVPQSQGIFNGGTIAGIPWWILLVVAAIAAAAIVLAVAMRRRRPREEYSPDMEAFAPAVAVGAPMVAGGAAMNPDMIAPMVPVGASDQSPDDLGGAVPFGPASLPPGTRVSEVGAVLATAASGPPSVPSAPAAPTASGPLCPRCGSGLLGEGIPCPTCQFVASPDAAAVGPAVPTEVMAPSPISPPAVPASTPPPIVEKLTHCPQCSGPLSPQSECPVCQVRWEPTQGDDAGGIGHGAPQTLTGSMPPTAPLPPPPPAPVIPADLTHCPQCGGPLAPGRVCNICQVSWEPNAPEPTAFTDRVESAPEPQKLPPTSSLAHPPPPEEPAAPLVPPPPIVREIPREPAAPATSRSPPPIPPPSTVSSAPEAVAPPPAPPFPASPPASTTPAEPLVAGPGRCFICSGPLENGYCSRCNMSWENEGG